MNWNIVIGSYVIDVDWNRLVDHSQLCAALQAMLYITPHFPKQQNMAKTPL